MTARASGLGAWLATLVITSLGAMEVGLCAPAIEPLSTAEPLVVAFRQGRVIVIDAALLYRTELGQIYVPLEETSAGLGLAIELRRDKQSASGFYLHDKNDFLLDLARMRVVSAGRTFVVEPGAIVKGEFDVFVDLESLNVWLEGMRFVFHATDLFVGVESTPPLPAVQQTLRQEARQGLGRTLAVADRTELPEVAASYELIRSPLIDVSLAGFWDQNGVPETSVNLRGVHDLLGLGAGWFVHVDQEHRLRDVRLSLGRKDPEGQLLGPLRLAEIEVGDIAQRGATLSTRGLRGAGLRFSSRTRETSHGSTTEMRGELPEGWEAELYQNEILSAFVSKPVSGQYIFSELPLYAGSNDFKVVLYGPEGQREEYRHAIRLTGNQPAVGKWFIEGATLLQDTKSLPVEEWLYDSDLGSGRADRDSGALAGEASVVYGLIPGLSVTARGTTLRFEKRRRYLAGLATAFSVGEADLNVDSVIDDARRTAASLGLATRVFRTGVLMRYEVYERGYRTPVNVGSDRVGLGPLRHRGELRLNRRLRMAGHPLHGVSRLRFERDIAGRSSLRLALDTSLSLGAVQLNKRLQTSMRGGQSWELAELAGALQCSMRHRWGWARAKMGYSGAPHRRFTGAALSGDVAFLGDGTLNLALNHRFRSGTSFELGLGWTFRSVELLGALSYSTTTSDVSANLALRFSLSWLDGGLMPRFDRRSVTSRGFARARVFLDRDGDGVYSEGDEAQAGVRLKPGRSEQTDREGYVTVEGLSAARRSEVVLVEDSLPDVFLQSTVTGYRVAVRPGAPVQLDFPVRWVSDVEGTVLVTSTDSPSREESAASPARGLGNVEVVVTDQGGREVRRVRSEFDGFFAVVGLPSGRYTLRMDDGQARRFGFSDGGGVTVTLRDDTAVLTGVELHLTDR